MIRWFGSFLFSERRDVYVRIAYRFNTVPWRVYSLAHGSKARSGKEERILHELKKEGIISVVRRF